MVKLLVDMARRHDSLFNRAVDEAAPSTGPVGIGKMHAALCALKRSEELRHLAWARETPDALRIGIRAPLITIGLDHLGAWYEGLDGSLHGAGVVDVERLRARP